MGAVTLFFFALSLVFCAVHGQITPTLTLADARAAWMANYTAQGLAVFKIVDTPGQSREYPSTFTVYWVKLPATIDFWMETAATGWISTGFSKNGAMYPADCITGWVDDNTGALTLFDTFSPSYATPSVDTDIGGTDDAIPMGGIQEAGTTAIWFSRKLDTGDVNDFPFKNENTFIIWGSHPKDGTSPQTYFLHYSYGAKGTNLFTGVGVTTVNFDPGEALIVIFLGSIFLYVVVRWIRKCYKRQQKKLLEKKIDEEVGNSRELTKSKSFSSIKEKKVASAKASSFASFFSRRVPLTQIPLGFVLLAILYAIVNIVLLVTLSNSIYLGLGDLVAANSFLLALPATRNSLVTWFLGIPYDKTILYHRWLGRFTIALLCIHCIMAYVSWVQAALSIAAQQQKLDYIYGVVGWFCAIFLYVTSMEIFRRKQFQFFLYTHFFFLLYYIFGSLHNVEFLNYTIAAAVIYVIDKLLRFMWGAFPQRTTLIHVKEGDMIQVKFRKHVMARFFKMHTVGQYMFLNFPTVNFMEWHPFSISSGPDEDELEVHIKALGDHTEKLVELAKGGKTEMWIRTDGPYGSYKLNYRRFPVLLLVSGGIGVTPIMSMLKDVYRYGARQPYQGQSYIQKVYFMWVVQTKEQYEWFREELKEMYEYSTSDAHAPLLDIRIYTSKGKGGLGQFFYDGKPDVDSLLDEVVGQYQNLASVFFTCGPRQMVNQCWDAVNARKASGHSFQFHHETFEF